MIDRWRRLPKDEKGLFLLFALTLPLLTPTFRGDGVGYYAYAASLLFDGDLDFTDEYDRADPYHRTLYFDGENRLQPQHRTPTGRVANKYSPGPSFLWSPFLLSAHVGTGIWNLFSADKVVRDGFSPPYLWAAAFGSALFGFIGILISHRLAKSLWGPGPAMLGSMGIWFASACPVYFLFLPFHSHASSVLVCSLLVGYWWKSHPGRTHRQWGVLGLLCGLAFDTYYLNGLLFLFPLVDIVEGLRRREWNFRGWGAGLSGLLIALLPLAAVKAWIYGSPLEMGYREAWNFISPRLVSVLFSPNHGLWSWTPIVFLACVGLIPLIRRAPALGGRSLLVFVAYVYVIASYANWHGQSSFSNRFFLSLTPIFVLGLAAAWDAGLRRYRGLSAGRAAALTGVLIVWNVGFFFQWGTNVIPNRGPVSWRAVARNQFTVVPGKLAGIARRFFSDRAGLVKDLQYDDMIETQGAPVDSTSGHR